MRMALTILCSEKSFYFKSYFDSSNLGIETGMSPIRGGVLFRTNWALSGNYIIPLIENFCEDFDHMVVNIVIVNITEYDCAFPTRV